MSDDAQSESEPLFRKVSLFRAKADDASEGTVDADPCSQVPRSVVARVRAHAVATVLERQLTKPVAGVMRGDGSTGSSVAAMADQPSLARSLFSRMLFYT